jgi:hypothetical protein
MEPLTLGLIDASISAMRTALQDEPELLEQVDLYVNELRTRFNIEAVGLCFSHYIGSELDFQKPGDRSLGQISTDVPRLGAYFRKHISQLPPPELLSLYRIIQDLMLRGYLTRALLLEAPPKPSRLTAGLELYETWRPGFYTSDPMQIGSDVRAVLAGVTDSGFATLSAFFSSHGMRGGGLFRKDKSSAISQYYPLAGCAVRAFEVGDIR